MLGDPELHRVQVLEERYCHQERLLAELSEVVYQQQRALERLGARLERAEQALAQVTDLVLPAPTNDKPPHY